MARKPATERVLRWGEGYVDPRTKADGTITYQARWRDGDRWRAQTFRSRDDAEDHLRAVGRAKRDGRYASPSDLTVADAIADYLTRGASRWAAGTVATYRQRSDAHILPRLGRRRLIDLATADVQRWVDDLGTAGLAPSTIQPAVAVLSGALKEAVRLGRLERNAAQGVRLPTIYAPTMTVWSDAEARRVLRAAAGDPRWRALYQVQMVAGMRPGEVRALAWADVDLERAALHVRRTMARNADNRWHVKVGTKRGTGRHIALSLPAAAALTAWRKEQGPAVYVFGGAAPLVSTTWVRTHRALCETAGVAVITLHAIRHTALTLLLERGVHPKVVSEIAGHSTVAMTLDRYSHVSLDLQRAAAERLSDWLNADDVSTEREDISESG